MRRQILNIVRFVVAAALVGTGAFLTISHAGPTLGVQWNQIGPAPEEIDAPDCCQGSLDVSGQVLDIAVDPRGATDKVIYIATDDGGIWQSTDGGSTWRTTTDFLNSLSMGAVALDPGNPSIVYAGTGDLFNNGFFKGIGIYKSTDAGGTWTLVPAGGVNFNGLGINRIAMPNPNTLLVATNGGLARSTNGGNNFSVPINGVFISDIHVDTAATTSSATPQTVLVAKGFAGGGSGIFRSTDSGATFGANLWTGGNGSPLGVPNFTPGFISFSQSTAPNNTIYASVQNVNGSAPAPFWGLFRSTDGGANWAQPAATGIPNCTQCGYDQTIGVEPNDAATVYLGFVNDFKSTDSGATFASIGGGVVHNDHHALVFSPHVPVSPPTTFYDGQDGGIVRSTDGGASFIGRNGPNPSVGKAIASNVERDIDIGRGSSFRNKFTYGGMQDTGTAQFTNTSTPQTWHEQLGGDGAGVAVDPFSATHAVGMVDACLEKTINGGTSWSAATFAGPPPFVGGLGFNDGTTLAFDQVNSAGTDNTVYASTVVATTAGVFSCFGICFGFAQNGGSCTGPELFRSTDGGSSYAQFASPTTYPAVINAIATAAIDPATIWLALNDGTLRVSTNATGGSPSFAPPAAQPPASPGPASAIAIDPTDTKTVVVTYANVSGQVFITTDGGATWANISPPPALPVHAVVIDPNFSPHPIIVGNDAGVLQTANNGASWQVLGIGMPTVDVIALALDPSASPEILRAGTFGRSTFELGAAQGPLLKINTTTNFGTLCPGQTPTEQLQLFNVGSKDLTVTSISLVSGSSNFTLSGPGFPVTISPDSHVDFTISYNPLLANEGKTETATFQINSNDVVNSGQQVTYSATVGQPKGSTTIADNGNYGNVCVGSFADLNLTVANSGSCDLLINNIVSSDANFLKPGTIAYPVAVHKGTSLAAPVRFQPITTGAKNGMITVLSPNNPSGNMAVTVSGNAPPGKIAVSGSGAFGSVCAGSGAQQVITVGNVGPCNLNVTSVTIDNGSGGFCPDFKIVNNPFPNILSPDSSLPVTVAFTPTSAGPKTCRLIIHSDDPGNPTVIIPLTATTGTGSIDVPSPENFPPTVIQSLGACASKVPFPVSNNGSCPLKINSVVTGTPGSNPTDFTLEGLPSLATPLQPGHTLGDGNLNSVFKPMFLMRAETGTITINYETDPVTHATANATSAMCGEGVLRGARVLVEAAGVPLPVVKRIVLFHLLNNGQSAVLDRAKNVSLQTVNPPTSCTTIQFHREWGGVSNPLKKLLTTTGQYEIVVRALVNGKNKTKRVKFSIDDTCSFNPNLIVNF